ncbi:hypothetical protein Hamer_G007594 [Homarus americanus]|uniref:Uncharacterized protein n=1 Tax=Homarus americanus TaxID=6706 RepID=A0A8J5MRE8_HOMAM|nr:hypothetical protein Hamer_G007594 [Homarus americanus]
MLSGESWSGVSV